MIIKCRRHSLGESPQVVATVTTADDLLLLRREGFPPSVDLLEFRLDNLFDRLNEAEEVAATLSEHPLIMTARHPEEGGASALDDRTRVDLLHRFLPHASLVDIEVRSFLLPGYESLIEEARKQTVGLIGSYHDFDKMPAPEHLYEAIIQAQAAGAGVAKLAVYLNVMTGLFELVTFLECSSFPLSVMGMGPLGKLSRLVLARSGSVLNYGYLQSANAPGQWQAAELKRLIAETA